MIDTKILFHARYACDCEVGSVDTVDGVHEPEDGNEAEIDLQSVKVCQL